jgi:hypothetical protein
VAIAEQFAKAAPFTVHIHRHDKRLGYRANFVLAASLCTSDVIAFYDQDDNMVTAETRALDRALSRSGGAAGLS